MLTVKIHLQSFHRISQNFAGGHVGGQQWQNLVNKVDDGNSIHLFHFIDDRHQHSTLAVGAGIIVAQGAVACMDQGLLAGQVVYSFMQVPVRVELLWVGYISLSAADIICLVLGQF